LRNNNVNVLIEKVVGGFFRIIFLGLFYGIYKLKNRVNFIIFLVVSLAAVSLWLNFDSYSSPYHYDISVWMVALLPIFYVYVLGIMRISSINFYNIKFEAINFIDRNRRRRRYPLFIQRKKEGIGTKYIFKSLIPIRDWETYKHRVETALDGEIINISEGKTKKLIEISMISSRFKLETSIKWENKLLNPKESVYVVGKSKVGEICFDINKNPHILIAGTTGSGKSVILICLLWQAVLKNCLIYMFDFKGGVMFSKIYEQFGEVVTERSHAIQVFESLVEENAKRLKLFRDLEVENIGEYNAKAKDNLGRICVFCDEIAEMLDAKGATKEEKEQMDTIKGLVSTLARLSRATGINLFMGTQRPDANIINGQIKNNLDVRLCGRFSDKTASIIVLGNTYATKLDNIPGRFIYQLGNNTSQFQAYFFEKAMIKNKEEIGYNPGYMITKKKSDSAAQNKNHLVTETESKTFEKGSTQDIAAINFDNFDFE